MEKYLKVNVKTGEIVYEDIPKGNELLGGRSLIANYLNDNMDPKSDALGPDNILLFTTGLLSGTTAPCSGRLSVGGKSPLTGGIKEANSGGMACRLLTQCGLKAVIVKDIPEAGKWYILKISSESAELLPADKYIGMNTYETVDTLRKDFGEKAGIITIGRAGEALYRSASIQISDPEGHPCRAAARGGLGAVMGSKGLKAVVIIGSGQAQAEYADKAKFSASVKDLIGFIKADPGMGAMNAMGTAMLVTMINGAGAIPAHNFRNGHMDGVEKISGDIIAGLQKERGGMTGHHCHPGCVIGCSNIYNDADGKFLTGSLEYETIALFGPNCDVLDLDAIAKMDRLCDEMGVDTIETACSMGVCMEAGKIGWGDVDGIFRLMQEMNDYTEFGKILGDGTGATARYLGVKRAPVVKNQALAGYDPRLFKALGVTYATSTMGADHTAGQACPDTNPENMFDGAAQVKASRRRQIMAAFTDSTGCCLFVSNLFDFPDPLRAFCNLIEGRYGIEWDWDKLVEYGENVLALERGFNKAAGLTEKDDRLPEFFSTEALPNGLVYDVSDENLDSTFDFIAPKARA